MKTASNISLAGGLLLLSLGCTAAAPPYTLAYAQNPPFSMTVTGQPQGIAVNTMAALFKRAGLPYLFLEVPLARAMVNALSSDRYCVFPVQRAQAIEANYAWVSPILFTHSGLYVRQDSMLQLITLNDAKQITIGVLRGSGDAEYLRDFGYKIEEANSQEQNLDKLLARRFDVWATDVLSANFFMQKSGGKDKAIKEALTFRATLSSLACNTGMPPEDRIRLQDTLDAMIQDGTLQKLTSVH